MKKQQCNCHKGGKSCFTSGQTKDLCSCSCHSITNQSNQQESWEEELNNLPFTSCPTEDKDPFWWRWTDEGKKVLKAFIREVEAKAFKAGVEEGRKRPKRKTGNWFEDNFTDEEIGIFIKALDLLADKNELLTKLKE